MSEINTWADVRRETRMLIASGIGYLIGFAFLGLCIATPILVVKWVLGWCE